MITVLSYCDNNAHLMVLGFETLMYCIGCTVHITVQILLMFFLNIPHLLVVLSPGPLYVLSCSPSCSQCSLVWQLFPLVANHL